MKSLKLGVIGCGNMGEAIIRGVVRKNIIACENILLNDKDVDKAMLVSDGTGCRIEDLSGLVKGSDLLLIAVKPQDFERLAGDISGHLSGQTVISVMAGITMEDIARGIGGNIPIVRAMPNMAAFVSEAVTCIACNKLVDRTQEVKDILSGIGTVIEVEESSMDAVTALSGSGPAYLFFLADAMMSAGEKNGLDKEKTAELVRQTLYGASLLLRKSDDLPAELIDKVASKGGTTEAALSVFRDKGFKKLIEEAVSEARNRSKKLSRG